MMCLTEIVKRAKALADEEEQYKLHVRYKQEICAIVGIPPTGAIPDTLTAIQIARLAMPDCEKTQKIIRHCLGAGYKYRTFCNNDKELTEFLTELALELELTLPDIVHWWLNGTIPRYAICSQPQAVIGNRESSQAAIEPANTKHIENMDKSITVPVQQEREKVLVTLLDELNVKNNGQLNLQALAHSKEDMRKFLTDKSSLFDSLSDSQFNKFWTAQQLCKLRRGDKPKS